MACLLGHLAATGEALVNSATFLVAGLDTAQESQIGMLASKPAVEAARIRSQRAGYLDGDDLAKVFAWLRPNDLVWNYWVNNYLLGQNPPAFDILYWNADTTRLPAGLHSDFLDLATSNGLAEGTLTVLGTPVDLGKVELDAYVVAGSTDHIVPWQAAYQTTQLLGRRVGVRAQLERSHPGHRQPTRQPEGVVPHPRGRAAGRRRGVAGRCRDATRAAGGSTGRRGSATRSGEQRPARRQARQPRPPAARSRARPLRAPHMTARTLTFVRVDGHLVRVSVRGEGRPLLLIMGLGGNIEMWDPLERALTRRGVQTIAYDASGTGESPPRLIPQRHARARPPGRPRPRCPRPSRTPTCSACRSAVPWRRS